MTTSSTSSDTFRAISLHQPWATLLAHGQKRVETRHWPIRHRGALVVHAAKKWTADVRGLARGEPFRSALAATGYVPPPPGGFETIPLGCLVGVVDVSDCFPTERVGYSAVECQPTVCGNRLLTIGFRDSDFGDYAPGRFAWLCVNFRPFCRPVPFRGAQGLFTVPADVVRAALAERGAA